MFFTLYRALRLRWKVFPEEVNPDERKLSAASPVGRALVGKREGDDIVVPLPDNKLEFEVLKVITIHEN